MKQIYKLMLLGFALFFIAACESEAPEEENGLIDDVPGEIEDDSIDDDTDEDIADDADTDEDTGDEGLDEEDTDSDGVSLMFVDHEGHTVEEVVVYEDSDPLLPEGPEKEGHHFVSWDVDLDTLELEENQIIEPIFAINVYDVTIQGPEGTIETLHVEHGEAVDLDDPQPIEGYRFVEYDNVPDSIVEAITIEAIYVEIGAVTLNFHDGYGNFMESYTGYLDDDFTEPEVAHYHGYTFAGWGGDLEGEPIDLDTLEAGEHDLFALYTGDSVTITFDFNDGTDPVEKTFEYGEDYTISEVLDMPERAEYVFSHWEDDEYGYFVVDYLFIEQLEPFTLEAQWDGVSDEWLFDVEEGEAQLTEYLGNDKDIVIPDTVGGKPVTVIGESLFNNHRDADGYDLDTLVIGENVHTIEAFAFQEQYDLESIVFENPDNIRHIGARAFTYVVNPDLIVPGYLETIGEQAFYRSGVTSVTFNGDIEKIAERAFSSSDLTGTVELPDSLRILGEGAFNATAINEIHINDTLTTIRRRAFAQVENLETVTIPSSVEVFGDSVFYGATDLESVTFESGSTITEIKRQTFRDTPNLSSVTLPEDLEVVGRNAFFDATSLQTLDLPDTVRTMELRAFMNMTSLESLSIPEGVTELPGDMLYGATSLTSVDLPESLNIIGAGAFNRAAAIETIDIPEGVSEIHNAAFREATSLHTLELPENLEVLRQDVFRDTESLSEVTIPVAITVIESGLFAFSNIQTVHLHDGITRIETSAFRNTPLLDNLVLPDSVTSIGQRAFRESGIEAIYIPGSVTDMGSSAFHLATDVHLFFEAAFIPDYWPDFNPTNRPKYLSASPSDVSEDD